ncbi:glycosyltransferase family 39 protein, partial [bacterium]|nr:glycosyltransferase family 39 protein [bacterium]
MADKERERLQRILLAGALLVALAAALFYADRFLWNSVDDAYIFLRYARNWLSGHGPVFNPGEPVEGYTSFGWLSLLTLLMGVGIPGPVALKLLSGLFGLGAVWMAWLLGRRLGGRNSWAGPIAAWLVALNGSFHFWHLAGAMETGALAVCLAGGYYLLLGRQGVEVSERRREVLGAGVLFGLGILVRPEGALFAFTALLWLIFSKKRRWSGIFIFIAPLAVLAGGQLLFRLIYYGGLLPNTFYAKAGLNRRLLQRGLGDLGRFLLFTAPPLLCLLAIKWKEHRRRLWPMLSATAAYWLYFVMIGGDWMVFRLLVPTLPLMMTASALGLQRIRDVLSKRRAIANLLAATVLGGGLALSTFWSEPSITFGDLRYYSEYLHSTADWLNE